MILIFRKITILFIIIFILIAGSSYINAADVNWNLLKENSETELVDKPDDIMSNFNLAVAMVNLGMIEEAYDYFDDLSDKFSTKEFNEVIAPYLSKLEKNKKDILLLNYAAFSTSINKDYKSAIEYFKQILKITPENIWIRNYLAATQINIEKYKEAEKVLKKNLKIKDNTYSHFLLAVVYYKTGNMIKFMGSVSKSGNLVNKFLFNK